MSLKLKTTTAKAVFEFDTDGMTASWTLSGKDSEEELVVKLEKLLIFLRRERQGAQLTQEIAWPGPVLPGPGYTPAVPVGAPTGVGTLMQQGLAASRPFTGIAPIQPVPLQDSVAHATSNGWELYTGNEDD